jgi:hypothetical protein
MTPPALPHANRETSSAHLPVIAREAEERLGKSSYRALRDVSCLASGDVIYLHGCLSSHYLKQVAQEVVSGAAGVHHVVNRIVVSKARPLEARPRDPCQPVHLSQAAPSCVGRMVFPEHVRDERSSQRC